MWATSSKSRRKKKPSSAGGRKRVADARRLRDAARRREASAVALQRVARGWAARRLGDGRLSGALAKRCVDLQRLWKVLLSRAPPGGSVSIPLRGLFVLARQLLRLDAGMSKWSQSRSAARRERLDALGVVLSSHFCVSLHAATNPKPATTPNMHDAVATAFALFCFRACIRSSAPQQARILFNCGIRFTQFRPEIVLPSLCSDTAACEGVCAEFCQALSSLDGADGASIGHGVTRADWWCLILRLVSICCDDDATTSSSPLLCNTLRDTVLKMPLIVSRDTEAIVQALSPALCKARAWATRLVRVVHTGETTKSTAKKTTSSSSTTTSSRACPILWSTFLLGKRSRDQGIIRDNVASLCVTVSLLWFKHLHDVPSGLGLVSALERRGMSRREDLNARHRARADLSKACVLLGRLLDLSARKQSTLDASEATRILGKEQKKILCMRQATMLLLLAEFEFSQCRRYGAALSVSSQLLEMGAKWATFPLWKRAKELSGLCIDAQKAVRRHVRSFTRRARSELQRKREAAAQRLREASELSAGSSALPNERQRQKRRRQLLARREMAVALRSEAADARERRREASRVKALAFSQQAARRAAEKRLLTQSGSNKEVIAAAVRRAIEESERECRAQATRIIEMREAMQLQHDAEEVEKQLAIKQARRENSRKREQEKQRQAAARIEENARSAALLKETEKREKERREREEAERAAEEEDERAFAEAEKNAREEAEAANPRCLFCGAEKKVSYEPCKRCFDTGKGQGQGADEGRGAREQQGGEEPEQAAIDDDFDSDALWDFDGFEDDDFVLSKVVGGVFGREDSSFDGLHELRGDANGGAGDEKDGTDGIVSLDAGAQPLSIEEALGAAFPDEWCCPLTLDCFRDPVRMVEDGQVYERDAIKMWFARGNTTSPMTNVEVGTGPTLEDEVELRRAIDAAIEEIMQGDDDGDSDEDEDEGETEPGVEKEVAVLDLYAEATVGEEIHTDSDKGRHRDNSPVSTLVRNADDATMICWSKALFADKELLSSRDRLARTVAQSGFKWVVFCIASGRFAAGVFHRGVLVDHKTMSRYTTRRKQGGSQSANDASGGGKAKSAGATLRRYNELEFHKQVHTLLSGPWQNYLIEADMIWTSCSKASAKVLWQTPGGSSMKKKKNNKKNQGGGALRKGDERIRKVPFPTARPSLEEVKRICRCAATCVVLPDGESNNAGGGGGPQGPTIRRRIPSGAILPLDTKRRREVVGRVMRLGYGEVMLWEVGSGIGATKGEEEAVRMLRRMGWRNAFGVAPEGQPGRSVGPGMLQSLYF